MKFPWQKSKEESNQHNVGDQEIFLPQKPLPTPTKGRIIVVANQKGGVGKTTTVVQTMLGKKKLLVDIDPQGNASFATGKYMLGADQPTMINLFENPSIETRKCIVHAWDGVDVLPCDIRLAVLEEDAANGERTIPLDLLKNKLSEVSDEYDYIFIDTPPSLGAWTINAFRAAHRVLVPIESSDPYSVLGFNQLVQAIHKQQIHNPLLKILGCFRTMLLSDRNGDERTKIGNQLWSGITHHYPNLHMRTSIPISVKVKEATLDNQYISTLYESNPAAIAYESLAKEIEERWEVLVRTW